MAPEAVQAARLIVQEERRVSADALWRHLLNSVAHWDIGEVVAARAEAAKRRIVVGCMLLVVVWLISGRCRLLDRYEGLLVLGFKSWKCLGE